MKITFLIPPVGKNKIPERIYGCSYQLYPQPELPILYAAAILEQGNSVDFRDFTLEDNKQKSFEDFINSQSSQIYILHSVLLSKEIDLKAAKTIRKFNPQALIIFFGPEPTRLPEEFLIDKKCLVVRGEPEIILKNLINSLKDNKGELTKIKGLSYYKKGKITHNDTYGIIENLDRLPFPARSLAKAYQNKFYNTKIPAKPHTLILTSRGCSFRCYFCVPNAISWARELEWKKYHQGQKPPLGIRSAQNIIKEFKQLAQEGYKSVWVMDDMFLWGKERIRQILSDIKDLNLELGILARTDFINKEIAHLLKRAGCKIVDMGIESFDQEILDYIQKDLKTTTIYQAIDALKKEKIIPEINLMFGVSPLETKEKIKETIKKAIKLNVKYVLFSIATPFPGTKLQEVAQKKGWLIKEKYNNLTKNLDPSTKALLEFPHLSDRDLEKLERYAKLKFYFRPSYIWWQLKTVRSLEELTMLIKTAIKILKQ